MKTNRQTKEKTKRIIWGVLLILTGICILLRSVGADVPLFGAFGIVDIFALFVIIGIVACAVLNRDYEAIPIPIAISLFVFEDNLAILLGKGADADLYSGWMVILCGALLCIGISMIMPEKHKKTKVVHTDEGEVEVQTSGGAETRYIDCKNFTYFYYFLKAGAGEIYFENTEAYQGGGVLDLNCRMGAIDVHVPRGWTVKTEVENHFGAVELPEHDETGGPLLTITGECRMGAIEIEYI